VAFVVLCGEQRPPLADKLVQLEREGPPAVFAYEHPAAVQDLTQNRRACFRLPTGLSRLLDQRVLHEPARPFVGHGGKRAHEVTTIGENLGVEGEDAHGVPPPRASHLAPGTEKLHPVLHLFSGEVGHEF
jgi:hypothetical protein